MVEFCGGQFWFIVVSMVVVGCLCICVCVSCDLGLYLWFWFRVLGLYFGLGLGFAIWVFACISFFNQVSRKVKVCSLGGFIEA